MWPFSIQLKILIRQAFLIGKFCSDFLVRFPFGAQIILSFEIFNCFSSLINQGLDLSTKNNISILFLLQQTVAIEFN